jgi:hypothetical protein
MSSALTIVLLTIADRDIADPFTPAVTRATREALGAETLVVSRNLPALPNDVDAAALGTELHADAVVEVTWNLPDHLRANIHLRRASTGRWVDREIGFGTADDPIERSRTIGFTVASMLPERFGQSAAPSPPPARSEAPLVPIAESASSPTHTSTESIHHVSSLAAMFIAALGVRDYGGGVGGSLDFRGQVSRTLSVRVAGGARIGEDPPAQVTTRFFYAAGGMTWDTWGSRNGRGAVGLRLDALAVRADFSRPSLTGGATEHEAKWMPGADLLLETSYYFTRSVALVAGAGGSAYFGRTDVVVADLRVTTVQPVHPVLEVGLRAGF